VRGSTLRAIILMTLGAGLALGREYQGPKCLGLFCIGDYGPGRRMFQQLGSPPQKLDMYCYQSRRVNTFLRVEMNDVGPNERIVEDVSLSDFSTCMHVPERLNQFTDDDLRAWRTPEGIGLGSSEGDVVRIYGKPDYEQQLNFKTYHLIIPGYRQGDSLPPVGSKILVYEGKEDESREASFGIRNGRVAWISMYE
jgi:hypothetical protein